MAVLLLAAACGTSQLPSVAGPETPSATVAPQGPSDPGDPSVEPAEPGGPAEPTGPSTDPAGGPATPPATEPSAEPSDDALLPGEPGPAAACTGTEANRDFYTGVAEAVSWTLLCPVLGRGWYVETGTYRLAQGGRLEITYRGPSGASLELREGAFCPALDGCVPAGSDVGAARLGPFDGTLVALDEDGWAIVVDRGASISWLLIVRGVDEAAARGIGERHAIVDR
jgi:hypothetical protein